MGDRQKTLITSFTNRDILSSSIRLPHERLGQNFVQYCATGAPLMIERLRARNEWKFAGVLSQASGGLATAWWILLVVRGLLPAMFAIAMGGLVGAIQQGRDLATPLTLVAVEFVMRQVLSPIHHA